MNNSTEISTTKRNPFKELVSSISGLLKSKWYMLFAFFAPIIILAVCLTLISFFSNHKISILILDLNAQYIYFFEELRDIFLGQESFFYSFERALGGELFGYYTYYLASPLSFLVAIFPKALVTEAVATMMLLKAGFSGLTFCIYLKKTRKENAIGFSMFSVMYALCAYATAYQSNIMWIDALIWLPLITLGIESMIKEGKFKLYIISLAIAIWSNYYIGYMLCIFTLIYFVFYLCTHSREVRNPFGIKKHTLKCILKYVVFTGVAIIMASAVILSAVYSLRFGKAGGFEIKDLKPTVLVDFFDVFAKMFIGTFGTFRPEGLPHVYAGTLLVLMLPIFFASKKITVREKIGYGVLCTVFLASFTISTLNLAWHGFSEPVWLSHRFSFMFSFILLIMAYKGYERLEDFKFKFLAISSGVIVVLLFILQKTVKLIQYSGSEAIEINIGLQAVWLTILLLIAYLIVIFFIKKKPANVVLSFVLCGIVCIEALIGASLSWKDSYLDAGSSTRQNYANFIRNSEYIEKYFTVKNEQEFFRVESYKSRKSNDNLVHNINGVSEFTSTFNEGSKTFLKMLGYQTKSQSSLYVFNNELSDSLVGIKYIISDEKVNKTTEAMEKSSLYELQAILDNDYIIYRNPYALPIAYTVSDTISDATNIDKKYTGKRYALALSGCMLGEDFGTSFGLDKLKEITDRLRANSLTVTEYSDTYIKGTVIATKEKPVMFTTIPYDNNWQVYVDGERVDTYKCVDALLAFDIDEGEHTIEMKYVPMQWYIGLLASFIGVLGLIGLCIWDSKRKVVVSVSNISESNEEASSDMSDEIVDPTTCIDTKEINNIEEDYL
ncbi:MAG: YfhO family protein [Clostridia bacterium]|nr:YfhO family protein [Clostridia bacterium]